MQEHGIKWWNLGFQGVGVRRGVGHFITIYLEGGGSKYDVITSGKPYTCTRVVCIHHLNIMPHTRACLGRDSEWTSHFGVFTQSFNFLFYYDRACLQPSLMQYIVVVTFS